MMKSVKHLYNIHWSRKKINMLWVHQAHDRSSQVAPDISERPSRSSRFKNSSPDLGSNSHNRAPLCEGEKSKRQRFQWLNSVGFMVDICRYNMI